MNTSLEQVLMRRKKAEMVLFLKDHPDYFEDAIQLALNNEQPLCW